MPIPEQRLLSYRDLIVWQKAVALVTAVYDLTATLPADERFGLVAQLRRAAVSVPANIAEGYGRATRGEYLNQLAVASGSLNEVETLCIVSERLEMRSPSTIEAVRIQVSEVQRMLARLTQRLRNRANTAGPGRTR